MERSEFNNSSIVIQGVIVLLDYKTGKATDEALKHRGEELKSEICELKQSTGSSGESGRGQGREGLGA
jgi:hypothetical protein